ncbi:chs [Acrasis kona]|uniref:Chs n=1 Tax=Acrasis kona TaxID=1008807 RepID=A0AAW2Z7F2_9EUKA
MEQEQVKYNETPESPSTAYQGGNGSDFFDMDGDRKAIFILNLALFLYTGLFVIIDIITLAFSAQQVDFYVSYYRASPPYNVAGHLALSVLHIIVSVVCIIVTLIGLLSIINATSGSHKVLNILYIVGLLIIAAVTTSLGISDHGTGNSGLGNGYGWSLSVVMCIVLATLAIFRTKSLSPK